MNVRDNRCIVLIVLIVVGFTSPAFTGTGVRIEEAKGTIEIQRAGASSWSPAQNGAILYENDVLRTAAASSAKLLWPDGLTGYIRENTQILVNLYENKRPSLISQHATIFLGAAYFLLRAALPGLGSNRIDTKIFTPTSVVAIRGTSFSVEVEKGTGTTVVRVTNGTVLVRNILQNRGQFVHAGFQTQVSLNKAPLSPNLMTRDDIAALRTWVQDSIVDSELLNHLSRGEKAREAMLEKLQNTIVVKPLVNGSNYQGSWDIGGGFSQFLIHELEKNEQVPSPLIVEQSLFQPRETALQHQARYVLTGQITLFELVRQGRVNTKADRYTERSHARIAGTFQLVDIVENTVISGTFSAQEHAPVLGDDVLAKLISHQLSPTEAVIATSIVGKAVENAASQATDSIRDYFRTSQESRNGLSR